MDVLTFVFCKLSTYGVLDYISVLGSVLEPSENLTLGFIWAQS